MPEHVDVDERIQKYSRLTGISEIGVLSNELIKAELPP